MTVKSELDKSLGIVSFLPQHSFFRGGSGLPKVAQQVGGELRLSQVCGPQPVFSPLRCADRWPLSWQAALSPSPSLLGYFVVFLAFLESLQPLS